MNNLPKKGTTFLLHDEEYEIQYVYNDDIRYSAINGGKTYVMQVAAYFYNLAHKHIEIIFQPELKINETNIADVIRRKKYIDAIQTSFRGRIFNSTAVKIINAIAEELAEKPPALSTVKEWIKRYKTHGDTGLIAEKKGNAIPRFSIEVIQQAYQCIKDAIDQGTKIIATEVHALLVLKLEQLAKDRGDSHVTIPGLRFMQRMIQQIDYKHRIFGKYGKHRGMQLIRAGGKKTLVPCPLSVVQIDTHRLDIIVVDKYTGKVIGRPYLVLIICVNTRMVVGFFISMLPPSATTTLQAFKHMLVNYGVCSVVIPDRGVEFINSALFHLCKILHITLEISAVREPNNKAHVESFFRTITKFLIQRLHGTTYSNVLERGDYDSVGEALFTLDQVELYIREWIDTVYHVKPHSQTRRAPIRAWKTATENAAPLRLSVEEVENLARIPHIRSVRKGQVEIHGLQYYSHALTAYNGQEVVVLLDELNMENVLVRDPTDKRTVYQAISTNPDYTDGLTLNQHVLAMEELKKLTEEDRKALGRHAHQRGLGMLLKRIEEDAMKNQMERKAAQKAQTKSQVDAQPTNFNGDSPQTTTRGKRAANTATSIVMESSVYVDSSQNLMDGDEFDDDDVAIITV